MNIQTLCLGLLATNCYLVWDSSTALAAVVDPADDAKKILKTAEDLRIKLSAVFLTHGHFDHMEAVDDLLAATGADFYISQKDSSLLTDAALNCKALMLHSPLFVCHTPTRLLKDGDEIAVGNLIFNVIETPGHTAGSVCYLCRSTAKETSLALFTGDLLFSKMIGRTDLPSGDARAMRCSLEKIGRIASNPAIYPGHGPASTLEYEKKNNIYLNHF